MSAVRPASAQLLALNGPLQGRAFPLGDSEITVGRSADCEISLDLTSVSRRHARFECRDGVYRVRDLGSRNGIQVNGRLVREAELQPGDVVSIGELDLRFSRTADTSAAALPQRQTGRRPASRVPTRRPLAPASAAASPRIGLNLKLILVILVTFALSITAGILWLKLNAVRKRPKEAELAPILIKADETKWLFIKGTLTVKDEGKYKRLFVEDFSPAVKVADPEVARAEKYDTGELIVRGKTGGDSEVFLTTDHGEVLHFPVLVRGRREDPLESLSYGTYSAAERTAMAEQFLANGGPLEREKPQWALQEYQKAVAVLQPLPDKGQLYLLAKKRKESAEASVDRRWSDLRKEISLALKNNENERAALLLQDALELVPDENDPRHQKADWFLRATLQRAMAERERRGR